MPLPNTGMDAVPFTSLTAEFVDNLIENIAAIQDGSSAPVTTNISKNLLTTDSNPYKFSAYRNASFNATNAAPVIVFDIENFDTNSNFSTSTGLYTAPVAGFYFFSARSGLATASGNEVVVTIQKSGADNLAGTRGISTNTQSGLIASTASGIIQLAATNTVGVTIFSNSTISAQAGPTTTYFTGFLICRT